MKGFLQRNLYSMLIGAAFAHAGWSVLNWEFWLYCISIALAIEWSREAV